ncbi:hypothetical protein NHF39_22915 [Pseudomonas proteolytica]|nr:hypothetical protein [Pseudomonas proteolytica]USW94160.1 hypothetical protein NHF39_22915 [Pseudomonas proteolytica]USX01871.1 hypothetical protein NHF41_08635 [Pseudomonas proteolytica]
MNDQNNGRNMILERKHVNDGMNVNPERTRSVLPAQPPKAPPPPPTPKKD